MSLLSSSIKLPYSSERSSSGVKIKRKSRRRRTATVPEPEEPERSQVEYKMPREKSGFIRRAHRDVPSNNNHTIGDLQPSSKRKSIVKSSGESSRRAPTNSYHRHYNVTPPLIPAATTKRQPLVSSYQARRSLTSSASSVRPSNRKRLDEAQRLYGTGSSYGFNHHKSNNNENEDDENGAHQLSIGADDENFLAPNLEDWFVGKGNNSQATRVLPSRASKYRNLSAGINKKPCVAVPNPNELPDRPPSRQRHAFPTHLIDANAFDAPETTTHRGGSSSASSLATRSSRRGSPSAFSPPSDSITSDRPPSRYMVKARRDSRQGVVKTPNGVRSRRGVVDKNSLFSSNQAHHDPKTDGFADVDESVPPPFRIKVTTDSNQPTLSSSSDSVSSSGLNSSQKSRQGGGWPSFSNQEQLLRLGVERSEGNYGTDQAISENQLQWFGKDDQINDAHLFETIISLPNTQLTLEADADIAIEDDLEDSDGPQYHSRTVVSNQQAPQELQQPVDNHFPSRRAAAASKLNTPKTSSSVMDKPELQWIRSSTNPFFVDSSLTVDYDSMDPETAIAQTPLYPSEDLMTLAATEMTDLHLDDYTAFGDISMPIAPPPSSIDDLDGSQSLPTSRLPLHTSLGSDFLSLFAQH